MLAAFDPSYTTGAAWGGETDSAPRSAVYRLPKDDLSRALSVLRGAVRGLIIHHGIKRVAIEAPLMKINRECSADSLLVQVSLTAVIREAAHTCGASVTLVNCHTWRKTFIGHGNLSGEESKLGAEKRCRQLGWFYENDDVAEAEGIWFHEMAHRYPRWRPGRMTDAARHMDAGTRRAS